MPRVSLYFVDSAAFACKNASKSNRLSSGSVMTVIPVSLFLPDMKYN